MCMLLFGIHFEYCFVANVKLWQISYKDKDWNQMPDPCEYA